ncbi:MAG TPA: TetR/AcrR family transcriptional regulator [Gaiellaceae bacterium]|nr:TetR/AcrR family transcriptional regulator [Gaiellaceae bacterium]
MATTTRQTAEERREDVLVAALAEFARSGFHGASTEAIAKRAGISQPYLFRLFGSKRELHLAVVRRCFRRTLETMQQAAEGLRGEEALDAMGRAYTEQLSTDPLMLQGQLQTYAAALDDRDVRRAVRDGYGDLFTYVERVSGASPARLARFFATGMLLNVIAAMGFQEEPEPEAWAARLLAGCGPDEAA